VFSDKQLAYLTSQRLARFATASSKGQPTVDAVGFVFDAQQQGFYIGRHNLSASRKYRNIAAGNRQVPVIIDDVASVQPWAPRGIKVHGTAEIVQREGQFGAGDYLAIHSHDFVEHRIEWRAE
jgi:pyridoxamine 5'-phosphate oxidase family protein